VDYTRMSAITLKVGFPPGCPTQYCTVRIDQNATVLETLTTITKKQNMLHPEEFLLFYPNQHGGPSVWLNNSTIIGSYSIKPQDLLEVKKINQIATVSNAKNTAILLLDITSPLNDMLQWAAVKLCIDSAELQNYCLYNSGKELNLAQSAIAQLAGCNFAFVLTKKDSGNDQSDYSAEQAISTAGNTGSDKDQSAPRLIASSQLHGYLKKQTTKKAWKQRYFVLKDRAIYYFHNPQERRPAGLIPLAYYDVKVANLQAKEAKYWALEFIYNPNAKLPVNSPKPTKKQGGIIIKFDNESEMHTWLTACKGERSSNLPVAVCVLFTLILDLILSTKFWSFSHGHY
jgi:hypothetical protein